MRLFITLAAIAVAMAAASATAFAASDDLRAPDQQAPAMATNDLRAPDQQAPNSASMVAPPVPADASGGPATIVWVLIAVAAGGLLATVALGALRWHRVHADADDLVPQ